MYKCTDFKICGGAAGMGCGGSTPAVTPQANVQTGAASLLDENRRGSVLIDQNRALDFDRVMDDHVGVETLLKFAQAEFSDELVRRLHPHAAVHALSTASAVARTGRCRRPRGEARPD